MRPRLRLVPRRRTVRGWLPAAMMVAAAAPAPAAAQETCPAGRISDIVLVREEPFADGEDGTFGWFYRALHAVHVRSRERTILNELHFARGDCLDPLRLEESERGLRLARYLQEAEVRSQPTDDGHRVIVRTRDTWALTAGVQLSIDDGLRVTGVTADAGNVLGTGTRAGFFRRSFRERRRLGLILRQPNLAGSRIDAFVHGGETGAGRYLHQTLHRPFAGALGRWAFEQAASARDDWFAWSVPPGAGYGQVLQRFEEERYGAQLHRRFGAERGWRVLVGVGASVERLRYGSADDGLRVVRGGAFADPEPAPPGLTATLADRYRDRWATRVLGAVGVSRTRHVTMSGLDAVRAEQDVALGPSLLLSAAPAVASDRTGTDLLLRALGAWGVGGRGHLLATRVDVQVRRAGPAGAEDWRDLVYDLGVNGYWHQSDRLSAFARARYTAAYAATQPVQLTLGGREGVRGYDDDAFPGQQRVLATAEQRVRLPEGIPLIPDAGVAVFADAGRGWAGGDPFGVDSGWRVGVGAGLRIALPPGSRQVLRVDVGRALTGGRDDHGVVFRIHAELFGLLDRRAWPRQVDRSRWFGVNPDPGPRVQDPLARNH